MKEKVNAPAIAGANATNNPECHNGGKISPLNRGLDIIKGLSDELESLDEDVSIIDLSMDYPELDYVLRINDTKCMPLGDIQAIKAKAKHGKTLTIVCLIAAMLKGQFMEIKAIKKNLRVLFFDTEQSPLSTAKIARKIHFLSGLDTTVNNDSFIAYTLRTKNSAERVSYIQNQVSIKKPDIIFIDGIRDLLEDFNDITQSNNLIGWLMRLSDEYRCSIVCVLHTNKSATDSNMRGHLGTELLNKCSDVWEVKKDGSNFIVSETDGRNEICGDWSFSLDVDGVPVPMVITPELTNDQRRLNNIKENFAISLSDGQTLTYSQLCIEYSEVAGLKLETAKKHISEAVRYKYIKKGSDEKYRLL